MMPFIELTTYQDRKRILVNLDRVEAMEEITYRGNYNMDERYLYTILYLQSGKQIAVVDRVGELI